MEFPARRADDDMMHARRGTRENITGVTSLTSELSRKRLELLKETVPRIVRVAMLQVRRDP
jgi:hypothetical protein